MCSETRPNAKPENVGINMKSTITFITKFVIFLLSILVISCNNNPKPSGLILIEDNEIQELLPQNFELHTKYKVVFVQDTPKLKYNKNIMTYLSKMVNTKDSHQFLTDTIADRISRNMRVDKVGDKFSIQFQIIDLQSSELPTIFGGSSRKDFLSLPLDMKTQKNFYLTKSEKDSLIAKIYKY